MALALIIYYEGEVSSLISIIQGNQVYEKSLKCLVKKPLSWFSQQFSVKVADKFNHDYEEIFIACHSILGIYKNVVILIITIYIVSAGRTNIFVTIFVVCSIYFSIGMILRKVQHKVIKHYYDYKYEFVKIFEECLDGGLTIQIFDGFDDVLRRTHKIYRQIAAYKLAQSYTAYGEELFCDLISLLLLVMAFYYGLEMKVEDSKYSMALIGTTIHLLLNVSEVLKNIVKLTINFETFFKINIVPFLQHAIQESPSALTHNEEPNIFQQYGVKDSKFAQDEQNTSQRQTKNKQILSTNQKETPHDNNDHIVFQNLALNDEAQKLTFSKLSRINLQIKSGSSVSIYQANDRARSKLVLALTKNCEQVIKGNPYATGSIRIGKISLKDIPDNRVTDYVGVIKSNNFFWTGASLKENITWDKRHFSLEEEIKAINYARELNLDQDLKDFDEMGLECPISFSDVQINSELSKKIAVLRTLIKQPKIVILKNTSSFIGETSIVQMIRRAYSSCTILKITGDVQQIPGMTRAIYMEDLKVIENDKLSKFENNPDTKIGKLLEQINIEGYEYFNKAVFSPRKLRKKRDSVSRNFSIYSGEDTERSINSQNSSNN